MSEAKFYNVHVFQNRSNEITICQKNSYDDDDDQLISITTHQAQVVAGAILSIRDEIITEEGGDDEQVSQG